MFYEVNNIAEAFVSARHDLLNAPIVDSRNGRTKELMPVTFKIKSPKHCLMYHPLRTYNLAFNLAEFVALVNGFNSVKFLEYFNKKISDYSDNGINFYGAYGPRVQPHIKPLIEKLSLCPDTRQAAINIFLSNDMSAITKDVPCTIALQFIIRNGKLNLHTMMRSNDLIWGFQYDVVQFCLLQMMIAKAVGLGLGSYFHTTTSLHVYEYHWELLEKMDMVESCWIDAPDFEDMKTIALLTKEIIDMPKEHLETKGKSLIGMFDFIDIFIKHSYKKYGINNDIKLPIWAEVFYNG